MLGLLIFCISLSAIGCGRATNALNILNSLHNSPRNVSYDHGAIIIDGKPRILVSGSIHYPRSTPEMWPNLIAKAKDGGLDVIQTYVFWNLHEPTKGIYDFSGRLDLFYFIQLIHEAGLFVSLRIGPYICAEWNYGGFPVWLHSIAGIVFRNDNEPFKERMWNFTAEIVEMMKKKHLYYPQGGPIILSQIENEYGIVEYHYGKPGKRYMHWAAEMALALDTGVPWIMCKQSDAPAPIINTWNGFYCDSFYPNSAEKPKICTEAWSGWLQSFGGSRPHRPVEDLAFAVARFYQLGGVFLNYYMYHGGTNFGHTAGGPFVTTSYDYDAPLNEYGNPRLPKWDHLRELHETIKMCEPALVLGDAEKFTFGPKQEGHIYSNGGNICAAFLANYDENISMTVTYNGKSYYLPAWSVSILPDCKTVVYNTAKVNSQTSRMVMKHIYPVPVIPAPNEYSAPLLSQFKYSHLAWHFYKEPIGLWGIHSRSSSYFPEQINTTKDTTDYLWYITSFHEDGNSHMATLSVKSLGHALHVFINKKLAGTGHGKAAHPSFILETPIFLDHGYNEIALLSMTVGLQNMGVSFDTWGAGVMTVQLKDINGSIHELPSQSWLYQIGLKGEMLKLFSKDESTSSIWELAPKSLQDSPMTWYKTTFDAPIMDDPVALDLQSMTKGEAWINGNSIGRYWPGNLAPHSGCSDKCDYRGPYYESKCNINCGQSSQRWYHVPRGWLQPTGNLLVLFEEIGGNPTEVTFGVSTMPTICASVSEMHFPPVDVWLIEQSKLHGYYKPQVRLNCGQNRRISSIRFASFGKPSGKCGHFHRGSCHALRSMHTIEEACIGREGCSVVVSVEIFGEDPCPGVVKTLAVEAECSSGSSEKIVFT